MSWAEVFKINSNMKKPLNEQIRDIKVLPIRIITSSTTYTPEKSGWYKIICVGAGADSYGFIGSSTTSKIYTSGGCAGGVAIKVLKLSKSVSHTVSIGSSASFKYTDGGVEKTILAEGGVPGYYDLSDGSSPSTPGTASGGDYNYTGGQASGSTSKSSAYYQGASVGVYLTELIPQDTSRNGLKYGNGILCYGGGASAQRDTYDSVTTNEGQPSAVIIIPLEMEE